MFISLKTRFFLLFLIFIVFTAMFLSCSVEARRLGGGHTIGKHCKTPYRKNDSGYNIHSYKKESKKSINNINKDNLFSKIIWPIITAFGLATLLSYFGMNSLFINFISILIISFLFLSAVYLVFRYFFTLCNGVSYRGKKRDLYDVSHHKYFSNCNGTNHSNNINSFQDFNIKEFSEQVKEFFLYIQELWKNGDINSLKVYLTDEMSFIIENDLNSKNYDREIEVLSLDSEFLNIDYSNDNIIANIRFFGMIKDNDSSDTTSFNEIWVLQKNYSSGWILAGINNNLND